MFLKASDVSTPRSTRACAPVNLAGALVKLFFYFGPAGKISLHGYHCYTVASILIIIIIIIIIIVGCAYKHTNILYLLLYLSYHPQHIFNMFQASRHMVVRHAAQENGARTNGVNILAGTKSCDFHASISL